MIFSESESNINVLLFKPQPLPALENNRIFTSNHFILEIFQESFDITKLKMTSCSDLFIFNNLKENGEKIHKRKF